MTQLDTNPASDTRAFKAAAVAASLAAASIAAGAEAEDKFLADIRNDDEDVNYAAWSTADEVDPSVIPALAELLTSEKLNVRRAADEALKNIVHSVGKVINAASLGANTGRPDDPGRMDRRADRSHAAPFSDRGQGPPDWKGHGASSSVADRYDR